MISFNCPKCNAAYELEDEYAGANAECEGCREKFLVPSNSGSVTTAEISRLEIDFGDDEPVPAPSKHEKPKLSPRMRRLQMDESSMRACFSNFPYINIHQTEGDPPERYVISYIIRGIEKVHKGKVIFRGFHQAEIKLTSTYPRTAPVCRMLTPVFHPNIEPSVICIGDHWTAAEKLCNLVVRIGELIAYQSHNIKSPLDGEAAMWTDMNMHLLPTDDCDLLSSVY